MAQGAVLDFVPAKRAALLFTPKTCVIAHFLMMICTNLKPAAYKLLWLCLLNISAVHLAQAHLCVANGFTVAAGVQQLDYREYDTQNLTQDGVLDSEKGVMPVGLLELNGAIALNKSQLWGNLVYEFAQGYSHYDGYLQSGRKLLPYQSTSSHIFKNIKGKVGVAFDYRSSCIKPYIAYQSNKWQRQLDHYTEFYQLPSIHLGAQWWMPLSAKLHMAAELGIWRFANPTIRVPLLNFSESMQQNKRPNVFLGFKLIYALDKNIGIMIETSRSQYRLLASGIDHSTGLQLPPSKTIEYTSLLGVQIHY